MRNIILCLLISVSCKGQILLGLMNSSSSTPSYHMFGVSTSWHGLNAMITNGGTTAVLSTGSQTIAQLDTISTVGYKYVEFQVNYTGTSTNCYFSIGISTVNDNNDGQLGPHSYERAFGQDNNIPVRYCAGTNNYGFGSVPSSGSIMRLWLDCENGFLYIGIGATILNGGVPTSGATGTGAICSFTPRTPMYICVSMGTYNGSTTNNFVFQTTLNYALLTNYTRP